MILSGQEIFRAHNAGLITIEPFNENRIGPNSYDLTLGEALFVYNQSVLDPKIHNNGYYYDIPSEGHKLIPGTLYLGRTAEYTETHGYVPMIEGVSSVARLGISIHSTAGFGDVGFNGYWTLEISCVQPVKVYAGMRIAQIYYVGINGDYSDYSGKYQNNRDIQSSRMWQEYL